MKFITVIFAMLLSICSVHAEVSPPSINTPQAASTVLAGPASGGAALPSFRVFTGTDLVPNFGTQTIITQQAVSTVAQSGVLIKNAGGTATAFMGTTSGDSGFLSIGDGAGNTLISLSGQYPGPTPAALTTAPGVDIILQAAATGETHIKSNPATTTILPFQLPALIGTNGNCLTTDGTGVLSWSGAKASQLTGLGTGVAAVLALAPSSPGGMQLNNQSGAGLTALNASQLTTGSVADARLSANVPLLSAANTFVTGQTVTGTFTVGSPGNIGNFYTVYSNGTAYEAWYGGFGLYFAHDSEGLHFLSNNSVGTQAGAAAATDTVINRSGVSEISLKDSGSGFSDLRLKNITTYASVTTAGWGVPSIYSSGRVTARTAAATLATYTCGAADGSFLVSANINVTTATAHNFIVTCTYTDETNTSRTMTMPLNNLSGTFLTLITNTGGAVPYESTPIHIRCKASTSITIATANGGGANFTTVTYNGEGCIQQIK